MHDLVACESCSARYPTIQPTIYQVAAMEAKGLLVPFAYGFRQDALVLRREILQIQVQFHPYPYQ